MTGEPGATAPRPPVGVEVVDHITDRRIRVSWFDQDALGRSQCPPAN